MIEAVQATLEADISAALGAEKRERTATWLGYRSGYYSRSLITRVGTLELRMPQERGPGPMIGIKWPERHSDAPSQY